MRFSPVNVVGAQVIDPEPHIDARGRFFRAWCQREFADHGIQFDPVQANIAVSAAKGTIRGLHYQVAPALEAKLVRCLAGEIFDVAVDLRPQSPTFRAWYGTYLSAENARMLFIPEGCAHGCLSMQDNTVIHYMASAVYTPQAARGVRYDDAAIGIEWPAPVTTLSDQDRNWPALRADLITEELS
jgi:dTDP-4-dehydrorhamnose 3,5-epimerase